MLSFQALQRAVSLWVIFWHSCKRDPGTECKSFSLNFLDVDSNRANTRASIKSLIPLPKVKTQTQKKSLKFSIIKMSNYLAKETLLPKQLAKKEIFSIRTKLRACYLDIKYVFRYVLLGIARYFSGHLLWSLLTHMVSKVVNWLNLLFCIKYSVSSEFKSINQSELVNCLT